MRREKKKRREGGRERKRGRQHTTIADGWQEGDSIWPWPPPRGNSVKVSADELHLTGGRSPRDSRSDGENAGPITGLAGPAKPTTHWSVAGPQLDCNWIRPL